MLKSVQPIKQNCYTNYVFHHINANYVFHRVNDHPQREADGFPSSEVEREVHQASLILKWGLVSAHGNNFWEISSGLCIYHLL